MDVHKISNCYEPFGDEVRDALLCFREGFPAIGWARRRCHPPAGRTASGHVTGYVGRREGRDLVLSKTS
jgi:hypothetical protein